MIKCTLQGCEHKILGQQDLGSQCGQAGGGHVWKEALVNKLKSGEWPGSQTIHWTCSDWLYTMKVGLDGETACCGMPSQDSILFHLEEIVMKLCDTPPLECQGPIQVLSWDEATSVILSPHGRAYYGLVTESWDVSSKYSTDPQCTCVYDNQTGLMDTEIPDDNLLNKEMDTSMSTNPLNPFNPFYVGPPLFPCPPPATTARDPVDLNSGIKCGEEGTNTFTDGQVLRHSVLYDPSVILTPLGFKGNKNLTINKMSLSPRYYERLHSILPNSVN